VVAPVHAAQSVAPDDRDAGQAARPAPAIPLAPENWAAIVEQLGLAGSARQLAANCALAGRQGAQVRLVLDARATRTPGNEARLTEALSRYLGEPVKVQFEVAAADAPVTPARELQRQDEERLAQARAALASDPTIKALQQRMGATIFPDSVRPTFTEEN
jgi:DNA polymerase-3 subunit gamma/tau